MVSDLFCVANVIYRQRELAKIRLSRCHRFMCYQMASCDAASCMVFSLSCIVCDAIHVKVLYKS